MIHVLLPRGWTQEIKRMWLDLLTHGLFLTWTQNLIILQSIHYSIYTSDNAWFPPNPLLPCFHLFTYFENQLLCSWCEYPSTLVPVLLTTVPPFHTPQIKLQYLHRRHQQHQPSSSGTIQHSCIIGTYLHGTYSTIIPSRCSFRLHHHRYIIFSNPPLSSLEDKPRE
jgi:hypothetical protein